MYALRASRSPTVFSLDFFHDIVLRIKVRTYSQATLFLIQDSSLNNVLTCVGSAITLIPGTFPNLRQHSKLIVVKVNDL